MLKLGLAAILYLLAPEASAQWRRTGLLNWSFDDITVDGAEGKRRSSAWSQSYQYGVGGPLVRPAVGDGEASVSFSKGADVRQAVNTTSADQELFGYSFRADLFRPEVRRLFSFSPFLSRQRTRQQWGDPAITRNLIDDGRGFNTGLNLPGLPGVRVNRRFSRLSDPGDPPSIDQHMRSAVEEAYYGRGPLNMRFKREDNLVEDRLAGRQTRTLDYSSDSELNFPEIKRGPLRTAFYRLNWRQFSSDSDGVQQSSQRTAASSLYATTKGWGRYVRSNAGFGQTIQRDLREKTGSVRHNATLFNSAALVCGSLNHTLGGSLTRGQGAGESASDSISADLNFLSKRILTNHSASGGWSRVEGGGRALSDSLHTRLTLQPVPQRSLYAEGTTNGSTPLGEAGGSRLHSLGLGASYMPSPFFNADTRLYRTQARSLVDGQVSVSDNWTFSARTSPVDRIDVSLLGSFTRSRSAGETATSRMAGMEAAWAPTEALLFGAKVTHADRSLDAQLQAGYAIGKTRLDIMLQRRELSTFNSYQYFKVSISRAL